MILLPAGVPGRTRQRPRPPDQPKVRAFVQGSRMLLGVAGR